jgi:hypothetical protein
MTPTKGNGLDACNIQPAKKTTYTAHFTVHCIAFAIGFCVPWALTSILGVL